MANLKKPRPIDEVKFGFDARTVDVRIDQLIPVKVMNAATRTSPKFKQIIASIKEVGIIEPPAVSPDKQNPGRYILLDGHMRVEALKELGESEVTCLISKDDEAFTYNKHINRLSTIQEHRMIVRAVERGVSEEKIAKALNVNVSRIVHKRTLIDGICDEAVEMLKEKMVADKVFAILKKMKPFRQIEVAMLMNDAGVYSSAYISALLAATPKDQLVDPEKPKKIKGLDDEQMARMESEMSNLQREYRLIEETYGTDVLNLTLAKGYLATLLSNAKVVRYLAQNHAEMLKQFQKISDLKSLARQDAA
jgi:ParB/RepB/Spo0J family partition protein